ncbi:helix-turn-helix transcriptional regulator [Paenibacillus alvei]|uniref:helix-turn-helix domain-containing protein n=1 Tax=Paenibacillus alvei TaxID=44250 RepID=UPI0021D09B96|nr:helix-turn-helix transcriptional regulator [Paenibacillus alvei]MCY9540452.1 helix-turn-helix transcriptional regulator [Paenibacillus alvei]MCY9705549.1 helix-turn-helix transcriptional regulator [Paenibacillus alvei]MCY9738023.1 helix-turn-helix transcriptional regulator [Paenibacillus alvei]MCY9757119.1 helix-turn-helix transcriptional regulator [Paenibacillus alvei]MEC0081987.1 helix-turn-helix transcriptional regulator [Paenibacillus alvei]
MIPQVGLGVGARIKKYRKEKKLTQKQLAEMINVSTQVISNWERDYSSPNSNDISNLSKALGCSSDMILFGYDLVELSKNIIVFYGTSISLDSLLKTQEYDVAYNDRVLSEKEKTKILKVIDEMLSKNNE